MSKSYSQIQATIITMKTLFIFYITFSFLLAYENVVVVDRVWGNIYSIAILFALPYLVLDYVIALLRYYGVIKDKKLGGIMIFDLLIDQAPRFPTKDGFVPNWKGYILQVVIGLALFAWFWNATVQTGAQWAGVPSLTPAQLTPLDSATKSALVAPPENLLSTTLTSIFAIIFAFIFAKFGKKGMSAIIVALLIGAYISSLYMADLHVASYGLDQTALDSIQKFFFVGNTVSAILNAQYAFDIFHGFWNRAVISQGMCLGSQCS